MKEAACSWLHGMLLGGGGITTQGVSMDELRGNIREAVACHFEEGEAPARIRLHFAATCYCSPCEADLCVAVDGAIEARRAGNFPLPPALSGKTFSGKFVVRIDPALHKDLAIRANQAGESLNNYVAGRLKADAIA